MTTGGGKGEMPEPVFEGLNITEPAADVTITLPEDCCTAVPFPHSFELQFDPSGNIINLPEGVTEKMLVYTLINTRR